MDPNNNFRKIFLETVEMKRKADVMFEAKKAQTAGRFAATRQWVGNTYTSI